MNAREWAATLNGREYRDELEDDEEALAKKDGIVIAYGYSDDNMEIRGAIQDEAGCYNGGTVYLAETGIFEPCREDEDCKYSEAAKAKCKKIEAIWAGDEGYSWTYETDIPHETFNVMEDGEKFCRGIVFHISELKQ